MKSLFSKLMVVCFLAGSMAAFAQSGDTMKHDDMGNDKKN